MLVVLMMFLINCLNHLFFLTFIIEKDYDDIFIQVLQDILYIYSVWLIISWHTDTWLMYVHPQQHNRGDTNINISSSIHSHHKMQNPCWTDTMIPSLIIYLTIRRQEVTIWLNKCTFCS